MITTKIAQILSSTRFVLAAGADKGVKEGMEFIIYDLSDAILDPETQESLGQLELHKGRIKVIHVQDKLSTATTLIRKVYRPSLAEMVGAISASRSGGWLEEHEQLPIDQTGTTAVKVDLTVKVGDLVRSSS